MLAAKLLGGVGEEKIYVDDVFSAYTYTGNGSTQTINNGIDLAGKGGLVWTKIRSGVDSHNLQDTVRGATKKLSTDLINGESTQAASITSFNSDGYSLGADANTQVNGNTKTYVGLAFRRAPKFFDVVTYTGDGNYPRSISHSLGQVPGMIVTKCTSTATDWFVYHRSLANTESLTLNQTTAKETGTTIWGSTTPTASAFTVGNINSNTSGRTYVAYLFAHDTSTDGLIQCGSVVASGLTTVTLNWETQYVKIKRIDSTGGWFIVDVARSWSMTNWSDVRANVSDAETARGAIGYPTAAGFVFDAASLSGNGTYIYLAILRPNKPPTTGTQVYNAIARTGTGAAATVTGVGFAPDAIWAKGRDNAGIGYRFYDRLRGASPVLTPVSTGAEAAGSSELTSFDMDGETVGLNNGINGSSFTYINHFFKRAPGVFDQVCYTGTGVAKTEAHGLGVVPELMIVKARNDSTRKNWVVYAASQGNTKSAWLESTISFSVTGYNEWNNASPTSSVFSVGTEPAVNQNGYGYVAYLFATKAGISKCGNYTGNGSSQTLDMGFTTGARFFMVKATSTTGSWWVFDTVRGVISAADPALQLNSTAAEITSADACDPDVSGIIVNQEATCSINANGVSYVFLALA